jgi:4-hydroxyacetophenone monooxygenase
MGGAGNGRRDGPDPARVEAAFAAAEVHPLLCAVAHRTGDLSLLRPDLAPDQTQLLVPGRGLGPEQEAEARALAAAAFLDHARSEPGPGPPGRDELRRVFGFLVGESVTGQWETFLTEELALEGTDPRAPSWTVGDTGRAFRCAVIGAGASGLAAAYRLRQAGVEVTVYEKNAEVGGTWL